MVKVPDDEGYHAIIKILEGMKNVKILIIILENSLMLSNLYQIGLPLFLIEVKVSRFKSQKNIQQRLMLSVSTCALYWSQD